MSAFRLSVRLLSKKINNDVKLKLNAIAVTKSTNFISMSYPAASVTCNIRNYSMLQSSRHQVSYKIMFFINFFNLLVV